MPLELVSSGKRNSSLARERTLKSASDRALQESIREVKRSRDEFVELNDYIRQILKLPANRTKSWLARGLHLIIPQSFYHKLPAPLTKMIAEELDALEAAEGEYRTRVTNVQMATKNLTHAIREKGLEIEAQKADIEEAREKNLNARELHEYIFRQADIEVDEEIAELLDDKFNVLGEEEKENRRKRLLQQLEDNLSQGRALVIFGVKACYASLEVCEAAAGEYYNFVNVYKPFAAIRDTAKTLVEAGDIMYSGRDALVTTCDISIRAIDNALDAVRKCRDHSIVSADMQKLLETGSRRIDEKLKLLASEDRKRTLALESASVQTKMLNPAEAEIIDVSVSAQAN